MNTRKALESKREQGKQTKEKIFSIIAASQPTGKSSADLKKETNLSRDRIHTICKEYMDEGFLYKTGRYGNYRLTEKALGDPARKGYLFGLKVMEIILSLDYISANNKFCNTTYNKSIINIRKGTNSSLNRDPHIDDKLFLFEFALRIGSIITYEMIQAIKFASESSEVEAKDQLAWKWINNVIHSNFILAKFADTYVVGKRLKRNRFEDSPRGPFYDMDKNELQSLQQSFQNVFPEVYEKSEDILSRLQNRIDSDRQYAKEIFDREKQMEIEDPKHIKCSGQLIPEVKTTLEGIKVQQCSKCHRWIKIRKSRIKR
ncbi:MAG: hypothetical protein ACRD5J_18340 [Nitrososphaeraceae archaeon]